LLENLVNKIVQILLQAK